MRAERAWTDALLLGCCALVAGGSEHAVKTEMRIASKAASDEDRNTKNGNTDQRSRLLRSRAFH